MANVDIAFRQELEDVKKELAEVKRDLEKQETKYQTDRWWLIRFFLFFLAAVAILYNTTLDQIGSTISTELSKSALKQSEDSAKVLLGSIISKKLQMDSILSVSIAQGKLQIYQGFTPEDGTPWQEYQNGVSVTVNTESYGFKTTPAYFPVLRGTSGHWSTMGVTSIYDPSPKGFTVYVRPFDPKNKDAKIDPAHAKNTKLHIQWVAFISN